MMCRRTSGNSSLSICRNIGRRCAIVLKCEKILSIALSKLQRQRFTHSSFPRMGASPLICVPREALTCWEPSLTKSSTAPMISSKRVWRSSNPQNPTFHLTYLSLWLNNGVKWLPGICPATAVRTSASESFKSLTKAGTRSRLTMSSPTAFAS